MAAFKPKVVDTTGVDGLLDDADNLELVAAPTANEHAANKEYVDDQLIIEGAARNTADGTLQDNIDAEETARIAGDAGLQTQINAITGGSGGEAPYVAKSGDDMTGDLTFNTDVIILDATNGTATFTGNVTAGSSTTSYGVSGLNSSDGNNLWQAAITARNITSGGPVFAGLANDFAATADGVTSVIYEDGSSKFSGTITSNVSSAYALSLNGNGGVHIGSAGDGNIWLKDGSNPEETITLEGLSGIAKIGPSTTTHINLRSAQTSGDTIWIEKADGTRPFYVTGNGTAGFDGLVNADISGNAATATTATTAGSSTYADNANYTYVEFDETTNNGFYVPFISNWSQDYKRLKIDGTYYYNPSENRLYVSNITGTLSGNATTATSANDSATLSGYSPTTAATANTVVLRDSSGHITANYLQGSWVKATHGGDTSVSSVSYFPGVSSDGWYYHLTQANMQTALNVPTRTGGSATGTWGINITGQANNATKLTTARSIALSGNASGSASFDGTGNISISTSVSYASSSGSCSGNAATASYASTVGISYNNDSNTTYQMLWGSSNSVYGTGGIYCNPYYDTLYAANFSSQSDIRIKDNIQPLDGALEKLQQIRGVEYDRIDKDEPWHEIGVIAQEVEKVYPSMITENDEGIKAVSYMRLIPVLIEAVKEQQEQIDELKKKLELN